MCYLRPQRREALGVDLALLCTEGTCDMLLNTPTPPPLPQRSKGGAVRVSLGASLCGRLKVCICCLGLQLRTTCLEVRQHTQEALSEGSLRSRAGAERGPDDPNVLKNHHFLARG